MARTDELRKRNADINRFRREAQKQWACASPFRQKRYINARLQGMTPEQAIRVARPEASDGE